MGVNALTCDVDCLMTHWPRDAFGVCVLCEADEMQYHTDTCAWSPIYAELFRWAYQRNQDPKTIYNEMLWVKGDFEQHVIKCAQCGRERLGRDMDLVYKSWVTDPQPYHPHNIVKAVCPEHNRRGNVGWRYAGVTD